MIRKTLLIICSLVLLFLIGGISCYLVIELSTDKYESYNLHGLPRCSTGLVPGTSKKLSSGLENMYFTYRIDAAEKLYKQKRVGRLILSGDNRVNNYNEPKQMKKALILRGVPDSCLVLDYAGLRTFDSMVRCKEIFGQDSVIVISQEFHNARAIFIGREIGMAAYGYNADKVITQNTTGMKIREFFSRIKCVLDLYLLDTKPRHLGEKIKID